MNTKNRFGEDKKINEVYEKINSTRFRNYIYDFDNKGTYCDYIDDYECKIDDLIYENQELKNQQKEYIEQLEKLTYQNMVPSDFANGCKVAYGIALNRYKEIIGEHE